MLSMNAIFLSFAFSALSLAAPCDLSGGHSPTNNTLTNGTLTNGIATNATLPNSTNTTKPINSSSTIQFLGINESGPEFGEKNFPGVYGTDYIWPNLSTIDTFIAQSFNTFRINTLMERMVPDTMTGPIDEGYMGNLTETVDYITSAGAWAMIVPHNYGRYYGNIIEDTAAFEAFWSTIAALYKDNDGVIFDTNNEYHDMSSTLVAELNQAAISGIRAAGATSQYIMVEGNAYTGAWTWTSAQGTDGKTNAETMAGLSDPEDKLVYQMHQYLDSDGSGTSETCVSGTIGSERVVAATEWLRENGKLGLIGEFAGAANEVCEEAVSDMLSYLAENSDVWTGALWWAAGPWWADYMFSVEPKDGPAFGTYVDALAQYA